MSIPRFVAAAVCAWLAGCAGLEVDVDVYKGPLANSDETQRQQLASMALSAKPLIVEYRNDVLDDLIKDWYVNRPSQRADYIPWNEWQRLNALAGTEDEGRKKQLRQARQLNGILSFYRDLCSAPANPKTGPLCVTPADEESFGFTHGRPVHGIESLADQLMETSALRREAGPGRSRRAPAAPGASARHDMLEGILVDFAARVQFFTNNQWLLNKADAQAVDKADRLKTLLETVSNTIMVQADELRRKDDHETRQQRLHASENRAARQVLQPNAESMVDDLRRRIESALNPGAPPRPVGTAPSPALDAAQLKSLDEAIAMRAANALHGNVAVVVLGPAKADAAARASLAQVRTLANVDPRDLAELQASLGGSIGAGSQTVASVKAAIEKWAAGRMQADADLDPAVRAAKPDYVLVSGLKREVAALAVAEVATPLPRDRVLGLLRKAAAARAEEALVNHRKLVALAARVQPAPAGPAVPAGTLTAEQLGTLRSSLQSLREEIVAALLKRADPADPEGARAEYEAALQRRIDAPAGGAKPAAELQAALRVLRGLALPGRAAFLPHEARNSIEVLDSYIAELRYRYLDAVGSGGDDSPDARNLAQALVQARKQRADMVYVRPSSAYLRSSLAATFAQENPHVRWTNMLNDTIQNLKRSWGADDALNKTREDLDKVFWQNINRVRLNAGGLTNYLLAKDDVGNWYVKGMGSDPSAMINAAKNLALFNMGGRLDTDLLRMDELRNRLDNDTGASEAQRQGWQDELSRLGGPASGAVVTHRSGTLSTFQKNYAQRTLSHLDDLSASLVANEYKQLIVERWTATTGMTPPAPLAAAMAQAPIEKLWSDATAATQNLPKERAAADAIIESLQILERYRKALRAAVLADPALVQGADAAVQQARKDLQAANEKVAQAVAAVQTSAATVARASGELKKARDQDADESRIESLRNAAEQAVAHHDEAVRMHEREAQDEARLRAELATRTAASNAALRVRERAADDVDVVLERAIGDWVARRVRTVEELETAASVVGRQTP